MDIFDQRVSIPVIDGISKQQKKLLVRGGEWAEHTQIIRSPAWSFYWPDDQPIVVDLSKVVEKSSAAGKLEEDRIKKIKNQAVNLRRDYVAKAMQEWEYDGRRLYGWGSAIKEKKAIASFTDPMTAHSCWRNAEQVYYIGTSYLNSALYGAKTGSITVAIVPDGTVVDTGMFGLQMCYDGGGLIDYELATMEEGTWAVPTVFGPASTSYQIYQYMDFDAIAQEAIERIADTIKYWGDPKTWNIWAADMRDDALSLFKAELLDIEPSLESHPFWAFRVEEQFRLWLSRQVVALPIEGFTRLVLPSAYGKWAVPDNRNLMIFWPQDSKSNTIPVEQPLDAEVEAEMAWAEEIEAVQYRLVSPTHFAKGVSRMIPGLEYGGMRVDMIISIEDFKAIAGVSDFKKYRTEHGKESNVLTIDNAYISFTQRFDKGQSIYCPVKQLKDAGRDCDGDTVRVTPADDWPMVFAHVQGYKRIPSAKVKKSYTQNLDWRWMIGASSVNDLVGIASSVMTMLQAAFKSPVWDSIYTEISKYIEKDKASDSILKNLMDTGDTRIVSEYWANRAIHYGTDLFKTNFDSYPLLTTIRQIITALVKGIGGSVPVFAWKEKSTAKIQQNAAFGCEDSIPMLVSELPERRRIELERLIKANKDEAKRQRDRGNKGARAEKTLEERILWPDEQIYSTLYRIYEQYLPWIREKYNGVETLSSESRPLASFVNWAPPVTDENMAHAWEMLNRYSALYALSEQWDDTSYEAAQDIWQSWIEEFVEKRFNGNRDLAFYSIWRAAHHNRGTGSSASSVFGAFPDEVKRLVRDKPGLNESNSHSRFIVGGLQYNTDIPEVTSVLGPLEVKLESGSYDGRIRTKVFLSSGFIPCKNPEMFLGLVLEPGKGQSDYTFPSDGIYTGNLFRTQGGKVWVAEMAKIA